MRISDWSPDVCSSDLIPDVLRDAAELDGYGHLGFLWHVAVPVTRPIIASFTVISFLSAWNQYLWPRAIITREAWDTIQRSEERRVGKACVSTRRSRWSPYP